MLEFGAGIVAVRNGMRGFRFHLLPEAPAEAVDGDFHRAFADGPALPDPALQQAAAVLSEQIAFASIIVLTKTDDIPAAAVRTRVTQIQRLQPRAAVALPRRPGGSIISWKLEGFRAPALAPLQRRPMPSA